ncbi:MAG: CPBP family intramembrane glutamic endopeptidase [Pseudomonadota bacterium]
MTPSPPEPMTRPWGPGSTVLLGLGLLVAATAAFGVGYIGLVGAGIAFHPGADVRPMMDEPLADMITTSLVLLVLLFGSWLAVLVRDLPARDYLALRAPALRPALMYAAIAALWIAAVLVLGPEFGHYPGLFLAERPGSLSAALLAAAALRFVGVPIAIEVYARGFLWYGLAAGRRVPVLAFVLTTLVATWLHCFFFAFGPVYWLLALVESAFLGMARARTGSLWLCVGLHAAMVVGLFGAGIVG